jgi:hypothetical protein
MLRNGMAYGFARGRPIANGLVTAAPSCVVPFHRTGTVPRFSVTNKRIRDVPAMQAPEEKDDQWPVLRF